MPVLQPGLAAHEHFPQGPIGRVDDVSRCADRGRVDDFGRSGGRGGGGGGAGGGWGGGGRWGGGGEGGRWGGGGRWGRGGHGVSRWAGAGECLAAWARAAARTQAPSSQAWTRAPRRSWLQGPSPEITRQNSLQSIAPWSCCWRCGFQRRWGSGSVTPSTRACATVASMNCWRRRSLETRLMPQRIDCAEWGDCSSGGPNIISDGHHQRSTASCTIARCASLPWRIMGSSASQPWRWRKLSSRQMRTMARAYGAYEQRHTGTWFMIAAPSTSQPMVPMSAQVSVGKLKIELYLARPLCTAASICAPELPRVSAAAYRYRPCPPSSCTLASKMALRLSVGARVIQLPSGSMPTISECACWLIWRSRVWR